MRRLSFLFAFLTLLCVSAFAQEEVGVEFGLVKPNKNNRYVDFKFMQDGHKLPYFGLKADDCVCYELSGGDTIKLHIDSLVDISNRKCVSDNLSIVILADQGSSISEADYTKLKEAIVSFVEALPENVKIYVSMLGSDLSKTDRVNRGNIRDYVRRDEFAEKSNDAKSIYGAIISKIQEIANLPEDDCFYPDVMHNMELSNDTLSDKMLFILSGKVADDDEDFYRDKYLFRNPDYLQMPEKLKAIYCVYFGEDLDEDVEGEFNYICKSTQGGRFYPHYSVDSVKYALLGAIDSISMDYSVYFSPEETMTYSGQPLTFVLGSDKVNAKGEFNYSWGEKLKHQITYQGAGSDSGAKRKNPWLTKLYGFLLGLLIIGLAYVIMQFLVPWVRYKIFLKKYVQKFDPAKVCEDGKDVVLQQCYYCKDNFEKGDTIVTKCKHTVHWECWEENHDRCPEYGLNSCKDGIYFYNKKKLTDERNSPYFTSWLMYGLAGGLISWLLFQIIPDNFFQGLVNWIAGLFGRDGHDFYRIRPLLLCGLILGFVITFLFCYLIEFRKKTWKTMLPIIGRSFGNAAIGFVAFLLGSIVIVAVGKNGNCWWIDWVPWLFFGVSVPWLMAHKTDIKFKDALIGGLISVVLSFVLINLIAMPVVSVLGFMIYAAGLGASIAVVHYTSENYFLHIEGPTKERDIAIYKWMNVAGGSNHVTIGRSPNCVIEMNWDDSDKIQDKQVELYIDNDHPYCVALADGTVYGHDDKPLNSGESILLDHGTHFTIGNTKFTYIEKDK